MSTGYPTKPGPGTRLAEKEDSAWKTWTPIVVSVIALLFSGLSAYYSVLRQLDDFRVTMQGEPDLDFTLERKELMFGTDHMSLAFTNLGNRAAAVTSVVFRAIYDSNPGAGTLAIPLAPALLTPDKEHCMSRDDNYIERNVVLDLPPFVVKPGEIELRSVKVGKANIKMKSVRPNGDAASVIDFMACLTFNVVTPDSESVSVTKMLFRGRASSQAQMEPQLYPSGAKPETLIRRSKLIFMQ